MKCNIEWLSAYLDGALAEDKRAKLEEHLKTCEACTAKLEEFVRVETTAKKIPAPQLSEAYWENFANRVQNKLTIREKQRTSPAWLEALKSFFQPTTGKLAIAGSVAVIVLLTFVSLDQWKKETFRPPVFEAETPKTERKLDSAQVLAKDESEFRTAEKDNKVGLIEDKRLDKPSRERGTVTLAQKPAENAPAASAPVGRMLAAPGEQISKEEPSLAAYAERDDAVKGDTVVVTAGKKAEIRKEVATSQVKVAAEETKKLPILNVERPHKTQAKNPKHTTGAVYRVPPDTLKQNRLGAHYDSIITKLRSDNEGNALFIGSGTGDPWAQKYSVADTTQLAAEIRQIIVDKEKELKTSLSKEKSESLSIYLAQYYVQLYRFSLDQNDWKKANQRLTDFLKTDLTESTRRWLVAIQDELKKLKK